LKGTDLTVSHVRNHALPHDIDARTEMSLAVAWTVQI